MAGRLLMIVPAYNEEANLPGVVEDLRQHQPDADILVVDDGSTDGTAEVARALGTLLLELPINLGIGGAVQAGFRLAREAGYHYAVQFDGDGQHSASDVAPLLSLVREGSVDVAIGSRFLSGRGFRGTPLRRIGIWIFRVLSRLTTRQTFTDSTSGFRAYNQTAIAFLADHYPSDYPEVESITILSRNRFRMKEVPVMMRRRTAGRSSITLGRAVYYMIKVSLASLISKVKPRHRET